MPIEPMTNEAPKNSAEVGIDVQRLVSPFYAVITYHRKETCNNCGSLNEIKWVDGEDGIMHEGETKCTCCGFSDYWAHGFFASMQDGYDKCEKYQGYR
jgi:hypothetical protein